MKYLLIDRYGRGLDRLRISVTNRCNHACIFCHREGLKNFREDELRPEDYGFLAKVAYKLGINKHKLTGGEPLIREDIAEVVKELKLNADEVTLSTNGSLLKYRVKALVEAGLDRANVSLHSLKDNVFAYIAKAPLKPVLEGIRESMEYGLKIKINYVVMKSNYNEFKDIINFALTNGFDLNIIELIPLGTPPKVYTEEHVGLEEIDKYLSSIALSKRVTEFQNRPEYILPSGVKVTLIKGYNNVYLCAGCTRLRVTPDGRFKTCLYKDDVFVDARPAIKARDEVGLVEAFKKAVSLREPYFKRS